MRYALPTVAAAAMLTTAVATAGAQQPSDHRPRRVESHVSLHLSRHSVLSGARLLLRGRVRPGGSHRVKIVFGGGGGLTTTTTRRNGAFALSWRPGGIGSYRVRAFAVHNRRTTGSASPARRITAFHRAEASYYGPGLYGGALACGGTLQPETLGVANKTLPCGARVKLRYRGRTIAVTVVDRGPYVAGRDFDLTAATKEKLGFPDVGTLLSSR